MVSVAVSKNRVILSRELIFCIALILFPVFYLIGGSSIVGYYDELMCCIGLLCLVFNAIKKRIVRNDLQICVLLLLITLIGFISNIVSALTTNVFAILIDVVFLWKPFSIYFLFKYSICQLNKERVLAILVPIAKITILVVCFISILKLFIDDSVTGLVKELGGIYTGWLIFSCIMILSIGHMRKKTYYKYLFIAYIPLILTFSSLVFCWIAISLMLSFFLKRNGAVKLYAIVILAVIVVAINFADISYYLLGDNIRGTLIRYGIKTGQIYFPLGSGFATYGSEMAFRYYSKLYISFGWENSWAYGRDSSFLNDNFFASIVGQFGFLGFALYLIILYKLFKSFNLKTIKKEQRVSTVATVLTICAVMVGSASVKTIMGCFAFATLGMLGGSILPRQMVKGSVE